MNLQPIALLIDAGLDPGQAFLLFVFDGLTATHVTNAHAHCGDEGKKETARALVRYLQTLPPAVLSAALAEEGVALMDVS